MLDWDADASSLAARLGLADGLDSPSSAETDPAPPAARQNPARSVDLPDFARLPAFSTAIHETAARGRRYCGLWRAWMPTYGRPDAFHCEHTVLWQDGAWLGGVAVGVSAPADLSMREVEVLRLVAQGWNDHEIAQRLSLSEHTVHRHVANIRTKLSVTSRTAAVAHAAKAGLI